MDHCSWRNTIYLPLFCVMKIYQNPCQCSVKDAIFFNQMYFEAASSTFKTRSTKWLNDTFSSVVITTHNTVVCCMEFWNIVYCLYRTRPTYSTFTPACQLLLIKDFWFCFGRQFSGHIPAKSWRFTLNLCCVKIKDSRYYRHNSYDIHDPTFSQEKKNECLRYGSI